MTYKTKLLLIYSLAMLLSVGFAIWILDIEAEYFVGEEVRAKTLSIAVTGAALLDGDAHQEAVNGNSIESEEFKRFQRKIQEIIKQNIREDTVVGRAYTLYVKPEEPGLLLYGVDGSTERDKFFTPGTIFHGKTDHAITLSERYVDYQITSDELGRWVSAWAPIRNREGKDVATLVIEIPQSRILMKRGLIRHYAIIALAVGIVLTLLSALILARWVDKPLQQITSAVRRIGEGEFDHPRAISANDEFGLLAHEIQKMAHGLKERDTVKSAFSRYVSHQVVDTVLKSGGAPILAGDRRRVTVLFCDIRGFTTLSEKLRPEDVVEILNNYFERVVDAIFRHGGTLDKFIGDGLMAIFGAPVEDPYQEEHALHAAIEIQQEVASLSIRWHEKLGAELKAGIGINSGYAIVGNIGSSKRLEYTAIGDTVNLASRLESATKDLGVDIVVSQSTRDALRGTFQMQGLGEITVKGKSEKIQIYTVEA